MNMSRMFLITNLVLLIFFLNGACANKMERDMAKKSKPEELTEYQGKKLSSGSDFQENSIKGPQKIDQDAYRLKIKGLVKDPKTYTYQEVIGHKSYQKMVSLDCVEGWDVNILWEGILVKDLLKETGVDPKAKIIIFSSPDGYSTSFPLNYIMDKDMMLAYKMNSITLPPERGFPFELVAENKWGYKWIKWVDKIELSADENYRGYWESRGYSNDGDLDKDFFEER